MKPEKNSLLYGFDNSRWSRRKTVTRQMIKDYEQTYFRLNMTNKEAMRHLRRRLMREGAIGFRWYCEQGDCSNKAREIHEESYHYTQLFNQDNYKSLCEDCHRQITSKQTEESKLKPLVVKQA